MKNQFSKEELKKLFVELETRLSKKAVDYKLNYALTDLVGMDLDEELLDVLGYIVLQIIRLREVRQKLLLHSDQLYWKQLLPQQKNEFLWELRDRINQELLGRSIGMKRTGGKNGRN